MQTTATLTHGVSKEPPPVAHSWGGSVHGRPVAGVNQPPTGEAVRFTLDGQSLEASPGETILEAAQRSGVEIPHLCYMKGMRADGNCRACVVEIQGERVLAPSCCRAPREGMNVLAKSDRALAAQRMVIELLLADAPRAPQRSDSLKLGAPMGATMNSWTSTPVSACAPPLRMFIIGTGRT